VSAPLCSECRRPRPCGCPAEALEVEALALEIAEAEHLDHGPALAKARRLTRDLIAYVVAWDRAARGSRPRRPPTA
jgi:hypothetical protein